jgi:hypothetical protein
VVGGLVALNNVDVGVPALGATLAALLWGGSGPTMPLLGLHVAIYLTYVAAIGTATVRAVRGEDGRLLTGLLAWSGVFGLGVGAYFAGRSTPDDLRRCSCHGVSRSRCC